MKALILNSGMGSRMGEETKAHPKCMTSLTGEETILSRQLRQLYKAGIQEVVMTTGYCNDILMNCCDRIRGELPVIYVYNEKYRETNYIYSIYQAREYLEDDILLLHGDLVFEDSVLKDILGSKESCMVVDSTLELPEKDFKAVVSDDRISKVGIEFFEHAVAAQPLYKILQKDWMVWLAEIESFCEQENVNCYAENAYNEVSDKCRIIPLDIKGRLCSEVDTMEDRERIIRGVMQMSLKETKDWIETLLSQGDIETAKKLIDEYEEKYPDDIDVISMKLSYSLMQGDIKTAQNLALEGVRRLPLNGDMHYNLAYVCEMIGEKFKAYLHYEKAKYIYTHQESEKVYELGLEEKPMSVLQEFLEETERLTDKEKLEENIRIIDAFPKLARNYFGCKETAFRNCEQIVGDYYYENEFDRRFVGVFKDQYLSRFIIEGSMDVAHLKAEFLKVCEGTSIHFSNSNEKDAVEYLLPIACSEENTEHIFQMDGEEYPIMQYAPNHFNYYRIQNDTEIKSTHKSYYGNPIPLKRIPGNKGVVLSIFVDGLSQYILKGEDFKKNMPYTYEFFKKGMICNRAYNTAEWTYPSIVNYVTGLDTTHHMLFHNELDCAMPLDVPTLAEYFHNQGYYTAKFCGNWRIIPPYGHARGYDRFVYQHQKVGFKVQEVIGDAINHLEAFKDVNQYLWISIGDLHDIADAEDLPADVQRNLPLSLRVYEDKGATSAKQRSSKNKTETYKQYARTVDRWLHVLYTYLEENFAEEEIVVSLFSDHGQGYLIDRDAHFLSKERSNVAFMFRGGMAEGKGVVDEIISTSDYSSTLRKLAGIELSEEANDGRLPKIFGGSEEREWALTESIHPKDFYQAAIFAKKETFFFVNPYPVADDGRFKLDGYNYWLEDTQGNRIQNEELCKKYLDIILKHIAPILIYE